MKIVIPTYNRSGKLERTLKVYNHLKILDKNEIIILDGSDSDHSRLNKNLALKNKILYRHDDSAVIERILNYLKTLNENEIIALSPDEDVILPNYLEYSEKFLSENKDYSMLIGRYITYLKKAAFFSRVSGDRDVIIKKNISYSSQLRRIAMLVHMLIVGCSPVFWGCRRVRDFSRSLEMQAKLNKASSGELLDQLYIAGIGNVRFDNIPMFLRDETKINVKFRPEKHDLETYIDTEDIEKIKDLLSSILGNGEIPLIFTDLFLKINDDTRFDEEIFLKRYYKFTEYRTDTQLKYLRFFARLPLILIEIYTAIRVNSFLKTVYGKKAINAFLKPLNDNSYAMLIN